MLRDWCAKERMQLARMTALHMRCPPMARAIFPSAWRVFLGPARPTDTQLGKKRDPTIRHQRMKAFGKLTLRQGVVVWCFRLEPRF